MVSDDKDALQDSDHSPFVMDPRDRHPLPKLKIRSLAFHLKMVRTVRPRLATLLQE